MKYYVLRIKYYILRYPVYGGEGKGKKLKKMETGEHVNANDSSIGQKIEATLHRLQELKRKVAELRHRCEELSARTYQEVVIRDPME